MFTTNFSILMAAVSKCPFNSAGDTCFPLKNLSGENIYSGFVSYSTQKDGYNGQLFLADVLLGDSDTKVENTQYNIQGNTITLNNATTNTVYGFDEDGIISIIYNVKGTPSADSQIKEFALIKTIYRSGATSGQIMIYREVLLTPIVLTADTPVDLMFEVKLKML